MFVIKRLPDGKFLAKIGHKQSYTFDVRYVRFFETKEDAERELCVENEVVIQI